MSEASETAMPPRYRRHRHRSPTANTTSREAPLQIGRLNLRLMLAH
jgi:hypothetical protein